MNLPGIQRQELSIESKRVLLNYLRSKPRSFTIENHLCLAGILGKAHWRFEDGMWAKYDRRCGINEAAEIELASQLENDKEQLLRQTVRKYNL